VLLGAAHRDDHPLRDRLVRHPLGDQLQNLVLARRQRLQRACAATGPQKPGDDDGVQRRAAVRHAADRADEILHVGDAVLEQVPEALRALGQ
jgi:hypothetical protein